MVTETGNKQPCYILISDVHILNIKADINGDPISYINSRLTDTEKEQCAGDRVYIVYVTYVNISRRRKNASNTKITKRVLSKNFSRKTKKNNKQQNSLISKLGLPELEIKYAIKFPRSYDIETLTVDAIEGDNKDKLLAALKEGTNVIDLPTAPIKPVEITSQMHMRNNKSKPIAKVINALTEFKLKFNQFTKIIELIGKYIKPFSGDTAVLELKTRCNNIASTPEHNTAITNTNNIFDSIIGQLKNLLNPQDSPKKNNNPNNTHIQLNDKIYGYLTSVTDLYCKYIDIFLITRYLLNYITKYYVYAIIYNAFTDVERLESAFGGSAQYIDSTILLSINQALMRPRLQIVELTKTDIFDNSTMQVIDSKFSNIAAYVNNFGFLHIPSNEYLLFLDEAEYKEGYCPNMFYSSDLQFNADLDNPYRFNKRMGLMIYLIDMHKDEYKDTESLSKYMETVTALINHRELFKPESGNKAACVNKQLYEQFTEYLQTNIVGIVDLLRASRKNNRTLAPNSIKTAIIYISKHIPKLFDAQPTKEQLKALESVLLKLENNNNLDYDSAYELYNLLRKSKFRIYVFNTRMNAKNIYAKMSNKKQLYFSYTFDKNKETSINKAHADSVNAEKVKPVQIKSQELSGPRPAKTPELPEKVTSTNQPPELPIGATVSESSTGFQRVLGVTTEASSTNTGQAPDYRRRASLANIPTTTSRTASTVSRRSSAGSSRRSSISSMSSIRSSNGSNPSIHSESSGYSSNQSSPDELSLVNTRNTKKRPLKILGVEEGESSPELITDTETVVEKLLAKTDKQNNADLRNYLLGKNAKYSTTHATIDTLKEAIQAINENTAVSKRGAIIQLLDKISKITERGRQIKLVNNSQIQSIAV